MQPLHVIYVDDESLALANFKATMSDCALFKEIVLFLDSSEAIAHVKTHPVDIAFLDIDLPGCNGFALSEELKTLCPAIRIAFITGNVRYMSKRNQIVSAPYIFKPYNKEDILGALLQVI